MILCRIRGRLSSDGEEGTSEKGGEVVEDTEKEYVRLPGPKLMGRGEGGVGGDEIIVCWTWTCILITPTHFHYTNSYMHEMNLTNSHMPNCQGKYQPSATLHSIDFQLCPFSNMERICI